MATEFRGDFNARAATVVFSRRTVVPSASVAGRHLDRSGAGVRALFPGALTLVFVLFLPRCFVSAQEGPDSKALAEARNHDDPPPRAQETASPDAKSAPAAARAAATSIEADWIHVGDTIRIHVLGQSGLGMAIIVPRSGTVRVPMAGTVRVSGVDPLALSKTLASRLRKSGLLVNPDVTVHISHYARKRMFVYGAVARAQQISIPRYQRLTFTQAIAMVGGFRATADRQRVKLIRREPGRRPTIRVIDANRIIMAEHIAEDIDLVDGDTVVVGSKDRVYVIGKVNRPGAYTVSSDSQRTLVKVIGLAGGFAPRAGSNRVHLFYQEADGNNVSKIIDVKKILDKGHLENDIALVPGSIVHVPSARW